VVTDAVASISMRTYFSTYHLWAARHFARLARDTERDHTGSPKFDIQNRARVTNAVLSAVAFLEAAINEVFDDVADGHPGYVDPLTAECRRQMKGLWGESMERRPVQEKYQLALLCCQTAVFDRGKQPYQDVDLLIRLRNRLTHARAQTRSTGDEDKLEEALKGKFSPSRLMEKSGNPYFPDHCLGAPCATWAVQAATEFANEFFGRLNLIPNYQKSHGFPEP
jgi:hypothetical protein